MNLLRNFQTCHLNINELDSDNDFLSSTQPVGQRRSASSGYQCVSSPSWRCWSVQCAWRRCFLQPSNAVTATPSVTSAAHSQTAARCAASLSAPGDAACLLTSFTLSSPQPSSTRAPRNRNAQRFVLVQILTDDYVCGSFHPSKHPSKSVS